MDHSAWLISTKYAINPRFTSLIILRKLAKSSAAGAGIFVFLVRKWQLFLWRLTQKDEHKLEEDWNSSRMLFGGHIWGVCLIHPGRRYPDI